MSRSTYIYIVEDGDQIVSAFTVKKEMIAWLWGQDVTAMWTVTRLRDGYTGMSSPDIIAAKDAMRDESA